MWGDLATGHPTYAAGSVLLGLPGAGAAPGVVAQDLRTVTAPDFDEVFRASYARLVGVLTAATSDPELAADCVQEAFVRAHVRWRQVGGYDDPVGWVRRVAVNLVRDHARREARRRRAHDRLSADHVATDRAHEPSEQAVDLVAALSSMPPQQRMALALYYVEGLSVHEVASEMRVSEGTVKFHLHSGRERFRALVDQAKGGDRD
jgi:RNA polymerase sigma-70 factor (ECF subfamily)